MNYFWQSLQASDVTIVEKYRMTGTISIIALVLWISVSKSSQSNLIGRYQVDDVDTCFVRPTFTL